MEYNSGYRPDQAEIDSLLSNSPSLQSLKGLGFPYYIAPDTDTYYENQGRDNADQRIPNADLLLTTVTS